MPPPARGRPPWAALALVLVAMSGCGGGTTPPPAGSPSAPAPTPSRAQPAGLVGAWHVSADDEEPDAILVVGDRVDGGLLLYRECGMLEGEWRANTQGMFVGALTGGSGDCFSGGRDPRPAWLPRVVAFRADGDSQVLLDDSGAPVATLTPGAHPSPRPDAVPEYASPPVVTDEMRKGFAEPAPLPAGVVAIDRRQLLGRWVPADSPGSKAFVRFDADGTYDGSDGCNGAGGRYLIGADGVVLATSGPTTLIGCENHPLPSWVAQSGRLGLRSGRLVFVAPDGKVLGEAERD